MTKTALAKLEAATCVGRHMKFKDKFTGVRTVWGRIEEEVYIMVGDYKHMIQRIKYDNTPGDSSVYGYRTCYYTLSAGGQLKFGQFAQQLTEHQYKILLGKAKKKGWPIF